ncbi:unnamed protein product [Symbiodinium natans]|uniref:EF-hand domain-containing protein n=1 Tax=Symbiodinium natans TaxID=878477 RepID=A0A812RYD0_9DINO|nr:unnamed protein product [Symbiodinium natans]
MTPIYRATSFSILIFSLILVNAILLGVEIDLSSSLGEADIPPWLGMLNAFIVCVFVLEIVLKFIAYGCRGFWRGPQAWWNIFDFIIVAISAIETALDIWARSLASSVWGSDAFSVVRTMRLARALRGMRFLRVFRYFSALRVLVLSIVSTINSLLWTMVLLFVIFYSFGVILTQLVLDYCRFLAVQASGGNVNAVPDCPAELQRYWSSIGRSMLTLFYAITNGVAWAETLRPLEDVSFLAVIFVIFYIIISVFTLLNVVTGVFVNTAIERASADKDIAALKAFQKRKEQMHILQQAFEALDHRQTNKLEIQDIQEAMGLDSVGTFLESLDISTDDIKMLFTLIDADNSGTIDLEEFVSGCMQLHGPAKSLQLAKMSYENKLTRDAVNTVKADLRTLVSKLEQRPSGPSGPSALIREPL